jgi:hypothetical protein
VVAGPGGVKGVGEAPEPPESLQAAAAARLPRRDKDARLNRAVWFIEPWSKLKSLMPRSWK